MTTVYLRLMHVRKQSSGDLDGKLIGYYQNDGEVQMAIRRVAQLPGFSDYPDDFRIEAFRLNEDRWTQGFSVND